MLVINIHPSINCVQTMQPKILHRILVIFYLLPISVSGLAQDRFNLGFEYSYPRTTIAHRWKTGVDDGIYSSDSSVKYIGNRALKITSPSGRYARRAYIDIGLLLNELVHTHIRIEAKVMSDTTQQKLPTLTVDITLNGHDTTIVSESKASDRLNKWTTTTLEFTLTEKQTSAYLSVNNNDKGTVWFDDIRVFSDGKEIHVKKQHSPSNLALMKKSILPFGADATGTFSLPDRFMKVISTSRVIGLGEGTHGTVEFRLIQQAIAQRLAQEQKPVLIALEASASASSQLNRYILTGSGDAKKILQTMNTNHFKYFCTEDFLNFIEWLKEENKRREQPIELYGVDVQYNNNAAELIPTSADEAFNLARDSVKTISLRNRYFYPNDANKDDIQKLRANLATMLEHLKYHKSSPFIDFYVMNALHLQVIAQESYLRDRDSLMAENLLLLNKQFPEKRIVFLANNAHCSVDTNYGGAGIKMAGYFFRKAFGAEYCSIGTIAHSGYYTAQNFALEKKVMDSKGFFTSTEFTSKNVTSTNILHEAPKGSIEHFLKNLGQKYAIVQTSANKKTLGTIRDIGLVVRDCEQFSESEITSLYDYVIFFRQAHATKIIPY
jgi:erythromycin esterase-like protein